MFNDDIQKLLNSESIGGNAGMAEIGGKRYFCAAANNYTNREDGEIIVFGNYQDIDPEIRSKNAKFTLRLALDLKRGFFKIIDFYGAERFSPNGRETIKEAIKKYNEKHDS